MLAAAAFAAATQDDRAARHAALLGEIGRMEGELHALERREGGVLDDLDRISAELSLGRARLDEISLRGTVIAERVADHERVLADLNRAQAARKHYLSFRLRGIYKGGSAQTLRRLLGAPDGAGYWAGLQYAALLNSRDRTVLTGFRDDERRVAAERLALVRERDSLAATRVEVAFANQELERSRGRQRSLLEEIRGDASRRQAALAELRGAADALAGVIDGLAPAETDATLDMRKFQGLLDWPAQGTVRAGFGKVVHPRFKTEVPHPGLDILAAPGDPIRAVFDGEVVFSGWMRGYGLTAIVDHGHGLHSVYAHAAVLWVEPGERIQSGRRIGIVGETGSFSGPSLYFELRFNGQAVDPAKWLRRR